MTDGAPRSVVIEADGGSRGNPGPAGYGAVVLDPASGEALAERYGGLGSTTNNVAEYSGLIAGLRAAAELGAREVEVRMDSRLVVEQMCGRWQIKHPGLRPLAAEAAKLVAEFDAVSFQWVPRERNKHADALANRAMDEAAGTSRRAAAPASTAPASPASAGSASAASVAPGAGAAAGKPPVSWEPPGGQPTRLVFVRHGQTELTAQGRYSGRGDVPLSEAGRAQARATAPRVAALAGPDPVVVSSPLSRCTATARIISHALGNAPVQVEADLIECDFGDWEGLTFAEVRRRWPEEMAAWLASPEVAPPGGESFGQVARRVARVLGELRERYPARGVVVVSHVSPIKLALRDALAATDAFLYRLYLDPAGVSIVDAWPDGGIAVRLVNDTAHLA